jgi:hypothetical protein
MLIQEIRARQALAEEGKDKYDLKIIHSIPHTEVDGKIYSLLFPKSLLNFNKNVKKDIDFLFIGLITENRKWFLSKFENSLIINSNRGRNSSSKEFDVDYFNIMSRAKFTLCPNGDFIWTYRFFESIIFNSIPIIEEECDLYKGYTFYKIGDDFKYEEDIVNKNLSKLKKEMML